MNGKQLYNQLSTISLFRGLTREPVLCSLKELLFALSAPDTPVDKVLDCYGSFVEVLYANGGNLSLTLERLTLEDENPYLMNMAHGRDIDPAMQNCLLEELQLLQQISQLSSAEVKNQIDYDGFLPDWATSPVDIKASYEAMVANLASTGYGIFAKYNGFTVKDGKLVPIQHMDEQTLDTMYGYERERRLVFENTRALAEGGQASNVLLYGDAGTGKSSTIKAVARHFYGQGLRLIEFKKNQLDDILPIMESLSNVPLKFIFYIDDLSFSQNDDTFCGLKGILEGSAASYAGNIAIYATSNRRHLVKESMDDRLGNQIHINDTMQETMSLAARFGLAITFSKPEKDLYLEIVKGLAADLGINIPEEELFRKAEAFAIRQNGRSPRTAKQFLQLLKIGL